MLRRFAELDPKSLPQLWYTVVSYLGDGDLSGARRTVAEARPRLSQPELVAHIAAFYDLVWVLDAEQLELLRRLSPAAFDDDAAGWAMCQAEAAWLGGDVAGAREYAGKSAVGFGEQLAAAPGDAQLHAARGVVLAMAGRGAEAVQDGERALDLGGPDKDFNAGPYILYSLARIHVLNGETEKAIDALERLVKVPNLFTRGWLRIDPYVAPLRSNPRFQKLVAASK
jgi:tetratricopeptide (TPR) repeat protein